jgi:energy-converting hydrogenase Eha subunit F
VKTYLNLAIAFILGLLIAITIQPSQAAPKTYDAVKLAEYSACLQATTRNSTDWIFPSVLDRCKAFKPR